MRNKSNINNICNPDNMLQLRFRLEPKQSAYNIHVQQMSMTRRLDGDHTSRATNKVGKNQLDALCLGSAQCHSEGMHFGCILMAGYHMK